ncbi:hypothetical protein PMAYCL1PPCAC_22679, partial [Pristionchus mayeri]
IYSLLSFSSHAVGCSIPSPPLSLSPFSTPFTPLRVIMVTFMSPLSMPIRVWMNLQAQQPMFGQMVASRDISSPYDDLQSDYVQQTQWSIQPATLGPKC